jgi:hypothetical protein
MSERSAESESGPSISRWLEAVRVFEEVNRAVARYQLSLRILLTRKLLPENVEQPDATEIARIERVALDTIGTLLREILEDMPSARLDDAAGIVRVADRLIEALQEQHRNDCAEQVIDVLEEDPETLARTACFDALCDVPQLEDEHLFTVNLFLDHLLIMRAGGSSAVLFGEEGEDERFAAYEEWTDRARADPDYLVEEFTRFIGHRRGAMARLLLGFLLEQEDFIELVDTWITLRQDVSDLDSNAAIDLQSRDHLIGFLLAGSAKMPEVEQQTEVLQRLQVHLLRDIKDLEERAEEMASGDEEPPPCDVTGYQDSMSSGWGGPAGVTFVQEPEMGMPENDAERVRQEGAAQERLKYCLDAESGNVPEEIVAQFFGYLIHEETERNHEALCPDDCCANNAWETVVQWCCSDNESVRRDLRRQFRRFRMEGTSPIILELQAEDSLPPAQNALIEAGAQNIAEHALSRGGETIISFSRNHRRLIIRPEVWN